jgi:hypothetical protein
MHHRHLPQIPLGNVGIEGSSTLEHYPTETQKTMDTKGERARNDKKNNTTGVNLKKSKNKSVTPSNEQTVWNRGGRTGGHVHHLLHLPLGNVGIECNSILKH